MTDFLELFNIAALIALIIFSAWSFYLKFKADRVTTTKDLLLAYVTGGALAVVTMVFGVTEEIVEASSTIKEDTVSIRATLEGRPPPEAADSAFERGERADPQINSGNVQFAELLRVNQQQTEMLRRLLDETGDLRENVGQNQRMLMLILENSGQNQDIPAVLSGPQLFIELDLFCTIPRGDISSTCVIRPNER